MQDEINFEEFKSLVLLLFPSLAAGQEKRAEVEHKLQQISAGSCSAHELTRPVAHRSKSKTNSTSLLSACLQDASPPSTSVAVPSRTFPALVKPEATISVHCMHMSASHCTILAVSVCQEPRRILRD